VSRQLTLGEVAAGNHHPSFPRTALDSVHREMGAEMDRIGGWWRPWTYGDLRAEYDAVRNRVSIGDVSTLGKMRVTGPDAEAFLQFIYPTDITTIRPGRSRYVLMLNERGYVFDDGLVSRELDGTFSLTFTSGGASHAEMWMRDWSSGYDVRIYNQTMSLGAINVTGPLAAELLHRAGAHGLPAYMGHATASVADVNCKVFRLSFTGEASFELHHPVDRSADLWTALMELGADLGIEPHGLQALELLRLEKGHILVGLDTDYDSTPRRIHHDWAVNMDKGEFLGRASLVRTDRIPLDRMLVGLEMEKKPVDGASLHLDGEYVGYVTSSGWSWTMDKAVMLAQLDLVGGELPDAVMVEGMLARRVPVPFYDPVGARARA
jgi:sarcosine oxidase subunit alpha